MSPKFRPLVGDNKRGPGKGLSKSLASKVRKGKISLSDAYSLVDAYQAGKPMPEVTSGGRKYGGKNSSGGSSTKRAKVKKPKNVLGSPKLKMTTPKSPTGPKVSVDKVKIPSNSKLNALVRKAKRKK